VLDTKVHEPTLLRLEQKKVDLKGHFSSTILLEIETLLISSTEFVEERANILHCQYSLFSVFVTIKFLCPEARASKTCKAFGSFDFSRIQKIVAHHQFPNDLKKTDGKRVEEDTRGT